ncbi:SIS domain-containing protein [Methylocapsa sp. S129]|uniref:KpsF/GutQ family sugar-phosphate isomerase n=1 Tax=Methylocapsa sp. S129 TaxID=1641869 RepID=UPI00131B78FE|nr:KpsF/GutQ family sugar-phosphate isomerase [Methylocapsa sp. S129]
MNAPSPSSVVSALRTLGVAREGLSSIEAALVSGEPQSLGRAFEEAVRAMAEAPGRVIVTGMGKSGLVARKIAATLASTGRPATFLHSAEASHGDLGMVQNGDVVLAISWSGETAELAAIVTYVSRYSIPLIAVTADAGSTLGRKADICLTLPLVKEACPHGLAPTTSTTMQLVLGDALAMALMESKGFTALDFSVFHPGGKLGAKLMLVRDVMHKGEEIPRVTVDARMSAAVVEISSKRFGCVGVFDGEGRLAGIITDGDLRRHMRSDLMDLPVTQIMTRAPITIASDALVAEALEVLSGKISVLLVVDDDKTVVGIVHLHDLLRLGAA